MVGPGGRGRLPAEALEVADDLSVLPVDDVPHIGTVRSMPSKTHTVAVPDEIGARQGLAAPDFAYACQLDLNTPATQSAEQWARAVFEDAPRLLRSFIVSGWIVGLGLRLGPRRSRSYVLGWSIVSNTPEVIVLGVGS